MLCCDNSGCEGLGFLRRDGGGRFGASPQTQTSAHCTKPHTTNNQNHEEQGTEITKRGNVHPHRGQGPLPSPITPNPQLQSTDAWRKRANMGNSGFRDQDYLDKLFFTKSLRKKLMSDLVEARCCAGARRRHRPRRLDIPRLIWG